MFDIGGLEMAVILLIALIVVGPKELPRLLKTVGHWVRKARGLAREFQSGLDDIVREAELDEAKKMIEDTTKGSLDKAIGDTIDPTGEMDKEVKEMAGAARELTSGKLDADDAPNSTPDTTTEPEATVVKHPSAATEPEKAAAPAESDDEAQKRA